MRVEKTKRYSLTGSGKNKDSQMEEENIQSLRTWLRKVEQSTTSISSRLSAVEKRISVKTNTSQDRKDEGDVFSSSLNQLTTGFKDEKQRNQWQQFSQVLANEFSQLQHDLLGQQQDLDEVQEQVSLLSQSLQSMQEKLQQSNEISSYLTTNVVARIETLERREPPIVRLGSMEVPIEVTGVIGGILAMIIAVLVALDYNTIVASPLFLFGMGLVLIGSAVIKSFRFRSRTPSQKSFMLPHRVPAIEEEHSP